MKLYFSPTLEIIFIHITLSVKVPHVFIFMSYKIKIFENGVLNMYLRIHWRLLTILKTNKKVNEVMFFDI